MGSTSLRQAARRSWRIPQTRPVRAFFLTYSDTMQIRAMKLMADKLSCSLAIEGELTDKGLAALSSSSDSMAKELAKMLVERSEDNRSLKDLWAAYRKKEVQVECQVTESRPLRAEQKAVSVPGIKSISLEAEQIGNKIVKVEFIEYIGKRKKKVTHVEVTQAELDVMLAESKAPAVAQFTLF